MGCCTDNTHRVKIFLTDSNMNKLPLIKTALIENTFYSEIQANAIAESVKVTKGYTKSKFTETAIFSSSLEECDILRKALKEHNIESKIVKIPKIK